MNNIQFHRQLLVSIRNFSTKQSITIRDPIRIEFEFFNTIDHVNSSHVGAVHIYGLKESTRKLVCNVGNEVNVFGGYKFGDLGELCLANVIRFNNSIKNNTVCTTLYISANYYDFAISGNTQGFVPKSGRLVVRKFIEMLELAANGLGYKQHYVSTQGFPEEYTDKLVDYFYTRPIQHYGGFSSTGVSSKQDHIHWFLRDEGITYYKDKVGDTQSIIFRVQDEFIPQYIKKLNDNSWTRIVTEDDKAALHRQIEAGTDGTPYQSVFIHPDKSFTSPVSRDDKAVYLSFETGLLGTPQEEVKLVNVQENWKLGSNETITRKGTEQVSKANEAQAKREAKAVEKGKTEKQRKLVKMQVSRKFVRVECQLNPTILPQSHVIIESKYFQFNGLYRVREVTYDCCNIDGSFKQTLFLEDPSGRYDTTPTEEEKKNLEFFGNQDELPQLNETQQGVEIN